MRPRLAVPTSESVHVQSRGDLYGAAADVSELKDCADNVCFGRMDLHPVTVTPIAVAEVAPPRVGPDAHALAGPSTAAR